MKLFCKLLFCCIISGLASTVALAAPTLTISSSGKGVFILQGADLQSVGGINATVRYDTTSLANPKVSQGGLSNGSLLAPNTNTPGVIHIGMLNTNGITGSGVLATISFDRPASSSGDIQSLTAEVINTSGVKIPFQVQVINPSGTPPTPETVAGPSGGTSPPTAPGTQSVAAPSASSQPVAVVTSQAPVLMGGSSVAPPGEPEAISPQPPTVVAQEPETSVGVTQATETAAPGETAPLAPERPLDENKAPTLVAYKSVLEKYRTFVGQKTSQALQTIFTQHTMPGIRQEPAIALSDGNSKLRLSITIQSSGKNAPNFFLKNAKLVSLKMARDSSWLIEVLPAKGVYSATLSMLQSGTETEIPLLVAPPLPSGTGVGRDGKQTEADFARFLTERGTDKAPRFDLNGDGKRDYIDDYIFTASYLLRKGM